MSAVTTAITPPTAAILAMRRAISSALSRAWTSSGKIAFDTVCARLTSACPNWLATRKPPASAAPPKVPTSRIITCFPAIERLPDRLVETTKRHASLWRAGMAFRLMARKFTGWTRAATTHSAMVTATSATA